MAIRVANAVLDTPRSTATAIFGGPEALASLFILGGIIGGVIGRWLYQE